MAGDLADRAVHGAVVLTRGDDQVDLFDQAVGIDAVVMEERAARRFAHPHRLVAVHPGASAHVGRRDLRIVEQALHLLQAGQDLDQARQVIEERGGDDASAPLAQLQQLGIGPWCADGLAQVQPCQRSHPVAAGLRPEGAHVGELEVAPGLYGLGQKRLDVVLAQAVGHQGSVAGHHADAAAGTAVVLPATLRPHQAEEQRGEVPEHGQLFAQLGVEQLLEQPQAAAGDGEGLRQAGADLVAQLWAEGAAHAARHRPGRVDLATPKSLDHPLAELAQADAGAGQVRVGGDQAEHIALGRVAVPAQQEIGAAEMKEGEGVALGDLGQVHQPPQLLGRRRDRHRQDLVAGLGRGQQMAHGADAADPRRDRRHLGEGPPLAEFLEAAVFSHVEAGKLHGAAGIQLDRDLGVTLDAGHRIDRDRAGGEVAHQIGLIRLGSSEGPHQPKRI